MALERQPAVKFGTPDELKKFRPAPDLVRLYHTVTDKNQGFLWLADKYQVPAPQIIGVNFPGAVENGRVIPEIVNWYLNYHEQFRCPETFDKKNRIFKGGEKVAIPAQFINVEDPLEIIVPAKRLNIWAGAGYKIGMTAIFVGNETGQIACVSLDDPAKGFTATITGSRLGIGIGASGSPILVIITSMSKSAELRGFQTGGWGYNLATGIKLNGILKNAKVAKVVKALSDYGEKVKQMGKAGAAAVKAGAFIAEYNSQIVDAVKMLGMDTEAAEPQILTFESPLGGFGAEGSIVHTVSDFHVEFATD
jgi:hypothetical protein